MLAIPGSPLAARKRRKRKKKKFCLEGDTIKSRNKKKKKRLRKQGATRGACPTCPDIQGVDELAAAIAAAVPGTTLRLCPGTFQLSSSLVVDQSLTIIGAGTDQTILDGGDTVRVLRVGSVDVVTLQDLTISRGRGPTGEDRGGGILNQGELTLRGVAVTNCSAELGGGMFSQVATLRLEAGTRVAGNAAKTGGGIFAQRGTVTVAESASVSENSAANGAGIFTQNTAITLETGSTVSANDAEGSGGGIFMQGGTLTLQAGSAVTDNTAVGVGGGIANQGGLGTVILDPGSIVTGNSGDNCDPDQGSCI
jgi:hypothetical protein